MQRAAFIPHGMQETPLLHYAFQQAREKPLSLQIFVLT
jgi:hypothetical protein